MPTHTANEDFRLSLWQRVREFAVPPAMIETATARRLTGDWAGACAAAGFDVDLDLRTVARDHGRELADLVRADLRRLAPDLLRWHLPRIAPDGLLRPGTTLALARYERAGPGPAHLVARTPPAWADAGQRISLALRAGPRDGSRRESGGRYPHPHPQPRFRLDLHRHLWDAGRSAELRVRSGADRPPAEGDPAVPVPPGGGFAVHRWAAEAAILLRAEERSAGRVAVRLGGGRTLVLDVAPDGAGPTGVRLTVVPDAVRAGALPVLPHAATWVPPDLELLRAGAITADRLHPLVAAALAPGQHGSGPGRVTERPGGPGEVECRGARHRIGLVDGALAALDHDPAEVRREELLAALGGPPLPCLQAIDAAHRHPECLPGIRERLDHGDVAGALAVVEGLLGPAALLRDGPLHDELAAAAQRRIDHGLFRAGLVAGPAPAPASGRVRPDRRRRSEDRRSRPRLAESRFRFR
ncbi:hypothetical protein GCM10010441_11760 [Kitasatospora paracochleata]|uniref:hypothetical protein n=1 Tax=Kitasatospora paracochleata TaxID=58354 RepID=UPI0031D6FDB7